MAILKSVVDVNNGNTGWSKSDVMDALETVFANLGFHGGSNFTGVPQALINPNNNIGINDQWARAGGSGYYQGYTTHRYEVTAQGTTAYRWLQRFNITSWTYAYSETNANYPSMIRYDNHGLSTGRELRWAPGEGDEAKNINGLTLNTLYYVIVVDQNYFRLAASLSDANNGVYIQLPNGGYSNGYSAKSSNISYFKDDDVATFDNRTINIGSTDILEVTLSASGTGNFHFCYDTDDYDANKYVVEGLPGQSTSYCQDPTGTGVDSGSITWDTFGYIQSYAAQTVLTFHPTENTTNPGRKYIYASDTNSAMKGVINIFPKATNRGYNPVLPFWDYEVPQNGGRSALKIRVYRHQNNSSSWRGKLSGMEIMSQGTGWSDNEAFTIPGNLIGGRTPEEDVTFGVRTDGDISIGDGTPALSTTTLGAGSNFFQKADDGSWAILKNVNDASKTYGTTYYSFGLADDSNNDLVFNSGSGYQWANLRGTKKSNGGNDAGRFTGQTGLDKLDGIGNYNHPTTTSSTSYWTIPQIEYCSNSTPTAYPLEIRVYRAQAPQDTNFAVIQFCQTINNIVQPYGAFTIYKGATFGSNVWDFDYVFNGSLMKYDTDTRSIKLVHTSAHPTYGYYSSDQGTNEEPVSQNSIAREAFYGYLRDPESPDVYTYSEYKCNIETDSNNDHDMYLYYRNNAYDQYNGNSIASEANYYKPFKGLPINERMVPCPYYLPDDFVMLQVSTTPGLTQFRTGDTVTIGGTETYEIIRGSYQTQQNGLDGVDNNSTIGMLFLARIS